MNMIVAPSRFAAAGGGVVATDPNFANVVLLVGADGTNGSTTFVDESPIGRALFALSNAQITTANPLIGSGSILLDGLNDYVAAADSAAWKWAANELFTIEAFVSFAGAGATNGTFLAQWTAVLANNAGMFFGLLSGNLDFRYHTEGSLALSSTSAAWAPVQNTRYHVAVDRAADGFIRIYVDGVVLASILSNFANTDSVNEMRIGSTEGFSSLDLNGRIDEVRYTKGVARYGGAFTPPTATFPRS